METELKCSIFKLKDNVDKSQIYEHGISCIKQVKAIALVMSSGGNEVLSGWHEDIIGDIGQLLSDLVDQIKFSYEKFN